MRRNVREESCGDALPRYAVGQACWGHSVLIFSAQTGRWTIYGRTVGLPRNFDTYSSIQQDKIIITKTKDRRCDILYQYVIQCIKTWVMILQVLEVAARRLLRGIAAMAGGGLSLIEQTRFHKENHTMHSFITYSRRFLRDIRVKGLTLLKSALVSKGLPLLRGQFCGTLSLVPFVPLSHRFGKCQSGFPQ